MDPKHVRSLIDGGDYETAALMHSPPKLIYELSRFKSSDPRIAAIKAEVSFIARFTAEDSLNVFISGETGTGKELIASALASVGTGQFVALNCAALPQDLIESELFGHRKGAFTGAHDDKPGLIQAATRGTLFLDEIGDMPLAAQAKLLRVMSTRKVRRVGDTVDQPYHVDCRFIGATHRDIHARIKLGAFREDLYWRLAQWTIHIPPLRERRGDLLEIIHSIPDWELLSQEHLDELLSPDNAYTGNVRELHSRASQLILRVKMQKYQHAVAELKRAQENRPRV